jgi:hypothetical protein
VAPAVAHHLDLEAVGQGVGHRHADAVQAAGEAVGRVFVGLVELAAGVQAGEHHLDGGHALDRVDLDRDAAAVVAHAHRAVGVQGDGDLAAEAGHRLVGGVVDDFLDDVQRVLGAGVHARPLLDGLEALEDGDGIGGITLLHLCAGACRKLLRGPISQLWCSLYWVQLRSALRPRALATPPARPEPWVGGGGFWGGLYRLRAAAGRGGGGSGLGAWTRSGRLRLDF